MLSRFKSPRGDEPRVTVSTPEAPVSRDSSPVPPADPPRRARALTAASSRSPTRSSPSSAASYDRRLTNRSAPPELLLPSSATSSPGPVPSIGDGSLTLGHINQDLAPDYVDDGPTPTVEAVPELPLDSANPSLRPSASVQSDMSALSDASRPSAPVASTSSATELASSAAGQDATTQMPVNRSRASTLSVGPADYFATTRRRSSGVPANGAPSPQSSRVNSSDSVERRRPSRPAQGIAGALAASGMALATPTSPLGHPVVRTRSPGESSRGSVDSGTAAAGEADGMSQYMSLDDISEWGDVLGTGYALASSKRNSEFHLLFKNIPEDDYLIEDYGCAIQRDILVQGRLYISEHHLSFNANIFGWVTSLIIPFSEVVSIEKRMTAYVIPNAIQVTTLHARYTFASFLSRDTTYDLIVNIWRILHPVVPTMAALPDTSFNDGADDDGGDDAPDAAPDGEGGSLGEKGESAPTNNKPRGRKRARTFRRRGEDGPPLMPPIPRSEVGTPQLNSRRTGKVHAVTTDQCPTHKDLKETCMDATFPSAPEKIYNLLFTSGFMRDFLTGDQKLMEVEIGDWAPEKTGSHLLARSMSYIKPLTGSFGPKQTKCLISDETAHVDFDDYVCVITTTRTPDVPSGNAFSVKTRTALTWAKGNTCRVVVTTGVEWTKGSFLKGVIEKSCIEGQKTYHVDLEKALRRYIQQHRSEFLEEGQDPMDMADTSEADKEGATATQDSATGAEASSILASSARSGAKGIQAVATGLMELFSGAQNLNVLLGVVIVTLVLSNLWTISTHANTSSYARREAPSLASSAEVANILAEMFAVPAPGVHCPITSQTGAEDEIIALRRMVGKLEGRLASLRSALDDMQ